MVQYHCVFMLPVPGNISPVKWWSGPHNYKGLMWWMWPEGTTLTFSLAMKRSGGKAEPQAHSWRVYIFTYIALSCSSGRWFFVVVVVFQQPKVKMLQVTSVRMKRIFLALLNLWSITSLRNNVQGIVQVEMKPDHYLQVKHWASSLGE